MVNSKRSRVRRSHVLGGCSTCRRRHVKCDQKRPACKTCKSLGVTCEGFSDQVLWMRGDDDPEEVEGGRRGTRRHLYSEQSRLSMSAALKKDLLSGSIDVSLAEVDSRSRDPERAPNGEIVIGPFSVLDFAAPSQEHSEQSDIMTEGAPALSSPTQIPNSGDAMVSEEMADPSPHSIIDSLSQMDDFLHWSDLLSFSPDQTGLATHPSLSMPYDIPFDMGQDTGLFLPTMGQDDSMRLSTPQRTPVEMTTTTTDLLKDAQFLLKHFQDAVIPHIMAIPFGLKSPWRILNLPAAVVAFGDTTFLGTEGVSHARLANLYGLLACAALDLALRPPPGPLHISENWFHVSSQTYQHAKDHMQISLQHETEGLKKAKYKDQLMAANILTQYAILSGQQQHARCFLIDAERLLRLRGLSKSRISKKARLLHHVYTWLRIIGESTFLLHDYALSYSCLDTIGTSSRSHASGASHSSTVVTSEPNPRLDDFLRLETQLSDSDLNIDEVKDRASGFHDIHLHDSRTFSETLYKQIYGIPETWLSLMSQTTRLGNVMQTFLCARKSGKKVHLETWETLQRRSMRLENMVCTFNLRSRGGMTEIQVTSKPHACMLDALNAALMIFFYRRIRDSHPAVLQGHVDSVINSLEECSAALAEDDPTGPGTAWPVFIAGCEAITPSRREAILRIIDKASLKSGLISFTTARNIMEKVWSKQDENMAGNRGELMPSWIDIVRQDHTWPLFC